MCEHHSFFSTDNLIEFGLSMAVARQMVNYFNQSFATTIQNHDCAIQNVHVSINNKDVGPLNESEIHVLCNQKRISADTLAWMPGMNTWKPIGQIPVILKIIALTSPTNTNNEEDKI